jgi:hypothetical protein
MPHVQLNGHEDEHFYVYTEEIPDRNSSNVYMYSIVSKNANTNMGIIFLKRKPIYVVHSRYPDYEYQTKLLYMDASSLSRNYGDHGEAIHLAKRYESKFGEHTLTKFKTGELFEQPLQLFNQPPACISIHEPLSRPPVLSIIVQDPMDSQVSVVVCKVIQAINSYTGVFKGNPW